MKDLVLKNSEWYRGQGSENSSLLRSDGQRCCLGIAAKDCGIPDAIARGLTVPSKMSRKNAEDNKFADTWKGCEFSVASINDCKGLSDDARVTALSPYFENRGYNLIFDPDN